MGLWTPGAAVTELGLCEPQQASRAEGRRQSPQASLSAHPHTHSSIYSLLGAELPACLLMSLSRADRSPGVGPKLTESAQQS